MRADYISYTLDFKHPSGTSRGVLRQKESFFIKIEQEGRVGLGEVGVLRGLSFDDVPELEEQIAWTCANISLGLEVLYAKNIRYPSIQFALEQAFSHLSNGFEHFPSAFTQGNESQSINGLIWMGSKEFMLQQTTQRLKEGFKTLKMKVGAISWDAEKEILTHIRQRFSPEELEIRVDANGAFTLDQAIEVSSFLKDLEVHSIEQPLPASDPKGLKKAVQLMHIPVALDESLIGVLTRSEKIALLEYIRPQYIILKPSFIGGWKGSDEWIEVAESYGIHWWATSALESNIGLNAIAQWAFKKNNPIPQGLGTGSLYTNNIPGPMRVSGGRLHMKGHVQSGWELGKIDL